MVWVTVSRGHLSGGGDAPNHIQRRSRCTARPRGERRHHPSTPRTRRRAEWTWVARFFAGRVCVRACGLDAKVHGVTATPRTCKPPVRQQSARSDEADYYQTPGSPPPPRRHLKTTSGARRGRLRPASSCVSRGGPLARLVLPHPSYTYEFVNLFWQYGIGFRQYRIAFGRYRKGLCIDHFYLEKPSQEALNRPASTSLVVVH